MNQTPTWSQQLTQDAKDKIAEDGLLNMALKAVFEETGALNDIDISRLLLTARMQKRDGRKFLWIALNQKYGALTNIPGAAPAQMQKSESGLQCPNCKKEFKSQAALSGHGVNRCKG